MVMSLYAVQCCPISLTNGVLKLLVRFFYLVIEGSICPLNRPGVLRDLPDNVVDGKQRGWPFLGI